MQQQASFDDVSTLDQLHARLKTTGMGPGWNKPEPSLYPAPKKTFVPAHWRFRDARAALHIAGGLVSTDLAERRNLILANPIEGNSYATTRTLVAAYQMVRAHETARSHRHTPNALRLVMEAGPETYTIVQGRKYLMAPGDVLLTPNWLWHGHANEGDSDAYWIDFLDAPLVQVLEPMFFEQFPEGIEKATETAIDSPMCFKWADSDARLQAVAARGGMRQIDLGNGQGGPALDSIALSVQRLEAGTGTDPYRTTANSIFAVIDGTGETTVDGQSFTWSRGDVFAAPSWRRYSHRAIGGAATLLRVSDEPVMKMLNWWREG